MSVWDTHEAYEAKKTSLDLAGDLLAGTEAMRGGSSVQAVVNSTSSAATKWLPRFSSDSDDSYWRRWDRAYLYGAFAEAVDRVTSKVFAEPVEVQGLPEDMEGLITNADRDGRSLHRFMARHYARVAAFGGSGVLVAMPSKDELPEAAKTPDGDVSTTGAAMFDVGPYLIPVHRMSITDWSWGKRPGGGNRLEYLAIREESRTEREDGKRVEVERLRTWTITGNVVETDLYERKAGDKTKAGKARAETPIESATVPLTEIPFVWDSVTGPDDEDDPFAVDLPMSELAWLNLQHFRETAEQGVALLMSRSEGLVETGCPDDQVDQPLKFGLGRVKRSASSPGSYDLKFVGPSGTGVTLGEQSLQKIEERMARLGAQPLTQNSGNATATAAAMSEAGTDNAAASWARGTEDSFERAFRIADMWARPMDRTPIDKRLPDLAVSLKGTSLLDANAARENVRLVADMWRDGLYGPRVVLEAMVEARILPSDMDIDELEEWAAQEAVAKLARQMDMFAAASKRPQITAEVGEPKQIGEPVPPEQGAENMAAAMES